MSCSNNGKTVVNSILPLGGTTTTYVFDLVHYLCCGRKTCLNPSYPISATLDYKMMSIDQVGTSAYAGNIAITGTVTYLPYRSNRNCCGDVCPITESIFTTIVVPLANDNANNITAGIVNVTPIATSDCCSVTNVVSIESSVTVSPVAG